LNSETAGSTAIQTLQSPAVSDNKHVSEFHTNTNAHRRSAECMRYVGMINKLMEIGTDNVR
jgi:hypothetical protein